MVQPNITMKITRPVSECTDWNRLRGLDSKIWIAMMGAPLEILVVKRGKRVEAGLGSDQLYQRQGGHWTTSIGS